MDKIYTYISQIHSSFENTDIEIIKIKEWINNAQKLDPNRFFLLEFILRELINNAMEHGNQMKYEKLVRICVNLNSNFIEIEICDEGEGFELEQVINSCKNADQLRTRNRGLCMILELGWRLNVDKGQVSCKGSLCTLNSKAK